MDNDHKFSGGSNTRNATGDAWFRDFLRLTETRGLLPPWWCTRKTNECVDLGKTNSNHDLKKTADKGKLADYYRATDFPMQLRIFAEQVYGSAPGGQGGISMLRMKAAMENGQGPGFYTTLDASSNFCS
jgi:mitochondrial splicing suppressor protein 51